MWNELEETILREMEADRVCGLAIALVRDGETIHQAAYGSADLEADVPMTPETSFDAASITKTLVATALMPFVEHGALDLDQPVDAYLDGIRFENAFATPVTTRHLLTHTSGLPVGNGPADPEATSLRDVVAAGARVVHEPGTRIVYANWGYDTLGHLLGLLAERPWHEHIHEAWLEPLGMSQSRIGALPEARGHAVSAIDGRVRSLERPAARIDPPTAAGSLVSNVGDLARFLAMHLAEGRAAGRRLLAPESVAAMHRVQMACGPDAGMGLGFRVDHFAGQRRIGHGGDGLGTTNWVAAIPERGVGVALLSNLSGAQTARSIIGTTALRLLLGTPPGSPKLAPGTPPRPGRYRSSFWDIDLDLRPDGNTLSAEVVGGVVMGPRRVESKLLPTGAGTFIGSGGWFHGFTLHSDGDALLGGLYPYRFDRVGDTPRRPELDEDARLDGTWQGTCDSPLGTVKVVLEIAPEGDARLSALSADRQPVLHLEAERGTVAGEVGVEVAGFGEATLFLRLEARGDSLLGHIHARGRSFGEIAMPAQLCRAESARDPSGPIE